MNNTSGRPHSFGAWLGQQRQGRNLTQAELAQHLHCALGTLRKIEQDERRPSRALAERIATVLDILPEQRAIVVQGARGEVSIERLPLPPPGTAALEAAVSAAPQCHQLRTPLPDFVGRQAALTTLLAALRRATKHGGVAAISGVRGMGGIGKTELAYLAANTLIDAFPDAQLVVQMHGMSASPLSSIQAMQQIIHAFTPDARLSDDQEVLQRHYRSVLHGKRVLILADDVKDASQVQPLLPPSGCALLITSRQRFSLPGMTTIDLEVLSEADAVSLLRSLCARLDEANACALAQVCGSLPLALRVTGSLLANDLALDVPTYIRRLVDERQRLHSLRDPDDPQLDVEASLVLSYAHLDALSQQVFRQLGVVVADFPTAMAQAVIRVPAEAEMDIEVALHKLLRWNLVMYDTKRGRWRLHNLVRDLARRQLEAMGETEVVGWRYARAAVQIAQDIQEQYLAGGDITLPALAGFDAERAHIDAAHRWVQLHIETPEGDQLLFNAARATRHIQNLRYDPRQEIIPLWEGVRTVAQRLGNRLEESRALSNLGAIYAYLGEVSKAITYHEQTLAIAHKLGYLRGEGITLHNLGDIYTNLGNLAKGIIYIKQSLAIARELGDRRSECLALTILGRNYTELGEIPKAISHFEQAITIAHELGYHQEECHALHTLGYVYTKLGDTQRAIDTCKTALTIARAIGSRREEGYTLGYLAHAQAFQKDRTLATTTFTQALACLQEIGDRWAAAEYQWLFGLALVQHGEQERALPLLRTAVAYEQEIGHAKAAEYAALVTCLEAGEPLPPELHIPLTQRAIGNNSYQPTADEVQP